MRLHAREQRPNRARTPVQAPSSAQPRISNPGRVVDPLTGFTKQILADYYTYIAPRLLPFLRRRPVYLLRTPDGIGGEAFFQKHSKGTDLPGLKLLDPALDPGHAPLMVIDSPRALACAMQMGTVELHTCNATADRIDRPDCMVFDLDPDPALPWERVVEATQLMRVMLNELGLCSFLKTSGGKGLHLVVPLARRHPWERVAAFSKAVSQHMARTLPEKFSAKMGPKNRIGKVFVDYLRNRPKASTVAPYSVRARPGLPVATPIDWDELAQLSGAAEWTIATLPRRLEQQPRDPWQGYFSIHQILTVPMESRLGLLPSPSGSE